MTHSHAHNHKRNPSAHQKQMRFLIVLAVVLSSLLTAGFLLLLNHR
jgi:hypothetical protein